MIAASFHGVRLKVSFSARNKSRKNCLVRSMSVLKGLNSHRQRLLCNEKEVGFDMTNKRSIRRARSACLLLGTVEENYILHHVPRVDRVGGLDF